MEDFVGWSDTFMNFTVKNFNGNPHFRDFWIRKLVKHIVMRW